MTATRKIRRRWVRAAGACLALAAIAVAALAVRSHLATEATMPLTFDWTLGRSATSLVALSVPASLVAMGNGAESVEVPPQPGHGASGLRQLLLFNALWPSMEGRTRTNDSQFEVSNRGKVLMVLMESGAVDDFQGLRFDALKLHAQIAHDFLRNVCIPTGRRMPANVECTQREPTIHDQKYGLDRQARDYVQFPMLEMTTVTAQDVLEERDTSGNLRTLITCNPDGLQYPSFFTPSCRQTFVQPRLNALVQIEYRKALLPEWRVIEDKSSDLIASFIKQKPIQIQP